MKPAIETVGVISPGGGLAVSRGAMRGRGRRGATLVELLMVTFIFSFFALSIFVLFRHGSTSWVTVQQRSLVQGHLQKFQRDISCELRRTSLASIFIWGYTSGDSYKHAICCKSAMNDVNDPLRLGEPTIFQVQDTDLNPRPAWQRWVVYYITRMEPNEHLNTYGFLCASYQGVNQKAPDNICPHKLLVRKDIYLRFNSDETIRQKKDLVDPLRNGTAKFPFIEGAGDGVGQEPTSAGLLAQQENQFPGSLIKRARVLATDVLTFNFAVKSGDGRDVGVDSNGRPEGSVIAFDVRCVKMLEARHFGNSAVQGSIGTGDMTKTQYTIQLDNRVTPEN